jgi:F420-0:gamma-glutamyl ligase-like protein
MSEMVQANPGKNLQVTVNGKVYERIPVKTHVVMPGENLVDVVKTYALPLLQPGDVLFITEKIVAVSQGRAFPVKTIRPRKLAVFLSRFVTKTRHGIGLGIPETMEMAIRECGVWRILLAAAVAAVTKPLGRKGDFYRIAGYKASSIDGPTPNTIPPYNEYVVLGPDKPNKVAKEISEEIKVPVLIVDLNDLGGKILGVSDRKIDKDLYYTILRDNPLGQSREQTPIGIIRQVK